MGDVVRFPPAPLKSGDRLKVSVRLWRDGRAIVDTHLSDSHSSEKEQTARSVEGEMRLIREIVRLTKEAQALANEQLPDQFPNAMTRIAQALELLLALVIARMY